MFRQFLRPQLSDYKIQWGRERSAGKLMRWGLIKKSSDAAFSWTRKKASCQQDAFRTNLVSRIYPATKSTITSASRYLKRVQEIDQILDLLRAEADAESIVVEDHYVMQRSRLATVKVRGPRS